MGSRGVSADRTAGESGRCRRYGTLPSVGAPEWGGTRSTPFRARRRPRGCSPIVGSSPPSRRGRRRAARRPGRPGLGIVGAPTPGTSGHHPATRSCPVAREGDDSRGRCPRAPPPARPRVPCGKPRSAACDRGPVGRAGPPVAAPLACGRPVPWPAGWIREARRTSGDGGSSAGTVTVTHRPNRIVRALTARGPPSLRVRGRPRVRTSSARPSAAAGATG
jgi:hypothetical protein